MGLVHNIIVLVDIPSVGALAFSIMQNSLLAVSALLAHNLSPFIEKASHMTYKHCSIVRGLFHHIFLDCKWKYNAILLENTNERKPTVRKNPWTGKKEQTENQFLHFLGQFLLGFRFRTQFIESVNSVNMEKP